MAMKFVDRVLTVVVTATITSAVWIIAGGSLIEMANSDSQRDVTRPAEAAPSPSAALAPTETVAISGGPSARGDEAIAIAETLDTNPADKPTELEMRDLIVPVLNVRPADLSDNFSDSRGAGERLHEALDIMAPEGTSVVAAGPGTIEKLFVSKTGGNTLYVRSSDGKTIHYYAHLGRYAEGLNEGQRIRRGQRLGTVGSTGDASPEAPHLHFAYLRTTENAEWWEPANALNPYPLLTGR